jgi:hypothetical protein
MDSATSNNAVATARDRATGVISVLPDIELRLSPLYAWLLIGFGGVCLFLGILVASPAAKGHNTGLGVLICLASMGAIGGGNYWRKHLPIMVRMTSRELSLPKMWPRRVIVPWSEIAVIEKKTLTGFRRGVRQISEHVCIKLKNPLPSNDRLSESWPAYKRLNDALMNGVKNNLLGGYDLFLNPQDEFLRDADWFIAECKKRMEANKS